MADVLKPVANSDALCPFFKKPMRAVCHTCAMWDKLSVRPNAIGAEPYDLWDCTWKLNIILARDVGAATVGVQAAVESLRNVVHEANSVVLTLRSSDGLKLT